ncbi:hypothetical protein L083_3779 [Actinoplanes sp. N902-109]|nr:hypothetical protein L083_3779 [Actinoplanes sp. N902-109]
MTATPGQHTAGARPSSRPAPTAPVLPTRLLPAARWTVPTCLLPRARSSVLTCLLPAGRSIVPV